MLTLLPALAITLFFALFSTKLNNLTKVIILLVTTITTHLTIIPINMQHGLAWLIFAVALILPNMSRFLYRNIGMFGLFLNTPQPLLPIMIVLIVGTVTVYLKVHRETRQLLALGENTDTLQEIVVKGVLVLNDAQGSSVRDRFRPFLPWVWVGLAVLTGLGSMLF